MSYYETLYIVHPALDSGRLKDIILSIEESLKNVGGKTLSIDLWGKKRLTYLIDKQKYGTYVQLQFTGEGNCTHDIEMELEHNPNILSYLTTLIEEADVVIQDNDLDTQIAGQSRETKRIDVHPSKSPQNTIEKSSETSGKNDPPPGDNVDDSSELQEAEETDPPKENIDEIVVVREKE